jgi:hypothetical protein
MRSGQQLELEPTRFVESLVLADSGPSAGFLLYLMGDWNPSAE